MSTPKFVRAAVAAALVAAAAHGCGSGGGDPVPGPRRSVLIQLTDVVILPTYRKLAERSAALADAAGGLRLDPSQGSLAATQSAWRLAREVWKQSEAFRLGPSEDLRLRLRSKLDWSPANASLIEQEIAGAAEFTPEYVDSMGVSRRGLLALEYLLFDPAAGDAAVLAAFDAPDGARRLDLIAALALDVHTQSLGLVRAWDPAGDDYRNEFTDAGRSSEAFPELKKATDELVGAVVQLAVVVEEKKIGGPAGLPKGSPRPNDVEAARSGNAIADILDNLRGIENVYRGEYDGGAGAGLASLVLAAAPEIDFHVTDALSRAREAVHAIPPPLQDAVVTHPDAVRAAFDALHELRLTLAVDLVAAVGATPRFTSDGD